MASAGSPTKVQSVKYPRNNKSQKERGGQRRKQFTPRKRTSESEHDGVCDLCVQKIKIYAIGHCDHAICYRCSAKMRVLCEQQDCAICRVGMKKVIYTKSYQSFEEANARSLIFHRKNNVWFTEQFIKDDYEKLFEHPCPVCPNRHLETSFEKLETHMRKEHKLFYCNLCVRFNTTFTDECKAYTRESLARHRRVGDDDDSSHKGHPLCEFCDERYLDNDALLHHLRKDHYFCHFCDQDGRNQYYDGYADLREHYRKDHFLCEEGDCVNEQFTSVFGTELDLKAHRAAAHKDGLSRQQQKLERNIDLGFQYPKPTRGGRGNRHGGNNGEVPMGGGRGRGENRNGRRNRDEDFELAQAISLSEQEQLKKESSGKNLGGKRDKPRVQREQPKQEPTREPTPPPDLVNDFPTLGMSETNQQQNDPYFYSSVKKKDQPEEKKNREESSGETAASRLAASAGRSVGKITPDDFPTLGSDRPSTASATGIWSSANKPKKPPPVKAKQSTNVARTDNVSRQSADWKSKDDFPALGGRPTASAPPPSQQPPQVKKPVSVNLPQSKFAKSNVNLGDKDEFPTLGGGIGKGSVLDTAWGQGNTASRTSSTKGKKGKTPIANQQTPKRKPPQTATRTIPISKNVTPVQPSPAARDVNPISHDETVSIRIGSHKHTMRLTSTKYSDAIEDIEKPVEIPGVSGSSVQTVNANAFSLLSNNKSYTPTHILSNEVADKFRPQSGDFPELGGGKAGRIRGIGNSSYTSSGNSGISLSSLSREMVLKSTMENPQKSSSSNQEVSIKPPPLSSYAADWSDDISAAPSASQSVKGNMTFQSKDDDFPTLSTGGSSRTQNSSRKNKKKKKMGQPSVANLSKHFGMDATSSQNTGLLENLLQSQKQNKKSISDMLDQDNMFSQTNTDQSSFGEIEKQTNGVCRDKSGKEDNGVESEVTLDPRPDDDDIEGRNIWLINTVQQLCGTAENFTEFKKSSAKFRQNELSAEAYYENCKNLLGMNNFDLVFRELVDLLPDKVKQSALLSIHQMR